jgi:rare lipoprotein A
MTSYPFRNVPFSLLAAVSGAALLLTACGPSKPAYTSRVITTPENRQLQGHQRPYEVNGVRYQPLRSHAGYAVDGTASWYGKDFHGKKTSNGEIYDMYAMTAAHKTLPLGVFVRVTNRNNGKSVVVRVNDRGPFVKSRIIDLSFAAASALDVVAAGTAPVRVEALGFKDSDQGEGSYRQPESYAVSSYAVQVGAFTVEENARRLVAQLKKEHGAADLRQGTVDGKLFYRVQAGRYPTLEAAEAAEARFAKNGYPGCFVVALE